MKKQITNDVNNLLVTNSPLVYIKRTTNKEQPYTEQMQGDEEGRNGS